MCLYTAASVFLSVHVRGHCGQSALAFVCVYGLVSNPSPAVGPPPAALGRGGTASLRNAGSHVLLEAVATAKLGAPVSHEKPHYKSLTAVSVPGSWVFRV